LPGALGQGKERRQRGQPSAKGSHSFHNMGPAFGGFVSAVLDPETDFARFKNIAILQASPVPLKRGQQFGLIVTCTA